MVTTAAWRRSPLGGPTLSAQPSDELTSMSRKWATVACQRQRFWTNLVWTIGIGALLVLVLGLQPVQAASLPNEAERTRLLAQIEADRLLLSELRKPVPLVRHEAELYLQRVRELATASDPVRLSLLVHTVIQQAPLYFDWAEREFESPDHRVFEYYIGGARGFHDALEELRKGVLFTVMNRLETLAAVIDELPTE